MYQTERVVSQKTRVKEHLESGNPITPIEALNLLPTSSSSVGHMYK